MKQEPPALLGCAVHDLANQYDALAREWAREDDAGDPNGLHDGIDDQMLEIIQAASFLTARSKQGAAFQIMLASLQDDGIANHVTATGRKAARDRQQRLLYRVLEWFGLDDEELSDARVHAMPTHLDPREYRG